MRITRPVMAVGGVVVAAVLIGFTNPKTVHAVAAALVQVTNTASNPVVTQGTGHQAAQIVNLSCFARSCDQLFPNPGLNIPFSLPPGHFLVITSINIPPGCSSYFFLQANTQTSGGGQLSYNLGAWSESGTQIISPSGIVIGPEVESWYFVGADNCAVYVQGYLTSN